MLTPSNATNVQSMWNNNAQFFMNVDKPRLSMLIYVATIH